MTQAQIMQALKDWIVLNVDAAVTVVEANQNAPRPERPYVTIYITSTNQKEHANISAPNSSGIASIENENAVMVSLQCFGDDSKSIMDGLRNSLNKVSVQQALRSNCLPYIRVLNGVVDLTETVGSQLEARAGIDLEFRAVSSVADDLGVIESVEGTGTHVVEGIENNVNYQTGV